MTFSSSHPFLQLQSKCLHTCIHACHNFTRSYNWRIFHGGQCNLTSTRLPHNSCCCGCPVISLLIFCNVKRNSNSQCFSMDRRTPQNAPSHEGLGPYLIPRGSLGPPESAYPAASRSVHPILQAHECYVKQTDKQTDRVLLIHYALFL